MRACGRLAGAAALDRVWFDNKHTFLCDTECHCRHGRRKHCAHTRWRRSLGAPLWHRSGPRTNDSDNARVFRFLEPTPPTYNAVPKERKKERRKRRWGRLLGKTQERGRPPYLPMELGLGKILAMGFSGETSDQLPVASSFCSVWL